ncbi:hypothetical protein DFH07DRAFT_1056905 [Mycena maculata]|uniref:Condensation domain-containing protein n=1 Tax=Mycena maculata TaxID=230809 RepID=A0AAD7JY98_9AGAR|nr:hypothetical protein DFH07DRAFT_1056905 [Mycena maculata]
MAFWTYAGPDRCIFVRALGSTELAFYYDGHIDGTADTLIQFAIRVSPDVSNCVAPENITRAWLSLKAQFPLLGATVQVHNSLPQLVVAEERLRTTIPGEIESHSISSTEQAYSEAVAVTNAERQLSDNLLARIIVLSRTDDTSNFSLMIQVAHLITDGVGNVGLMKEFLDLLSAPDRHSRPDLESRLSLAVAYESLVPTLKMSVARQRWRRAAGQIICQMQEAKRTGGHALPRSYGPIATRLPARSGFFRTHFSHPDSSHLLQNCREYGITVGNALPVLAQVGLARVLCRRYVRGEISPEEWEFRKKQPYHNAGPMNVRPFLDKAWFQRGGHSNVSVNVGFFYFTLPFTPLGPGHLAPGDAVPELSELMSKNRFLLRCNRMKKMAAQFLHHPLFFEVNASSVSRRIPLRKAAAAEWEADPDSLVVPGEVERHNVSAIEQANYGTVMSHGWSTFGNDKGFPRKYPIHSAEPTLVLEKYQSFLHCRTGELYLGAGTYADQLHFSVFFDSNVYSADVIEEWLGEIQQAMHLYLSDAQAVVSKM